MKTSVIVKLWGVEVGRLSWEERRSLAYFTFHPDFCSKGWDVAPFVMRAPLFDAKLPEMGNTEQRMYQRLPPFLADSLPDAWGSQLFEQWIQQQGLRHQDVTPLEKLCFIGRRGMGALEFEPETEMAIRQDTIDVAALNQLARRIYEQRESVQILPEETITMQSLMQVGTSAGGMRPKAILAINPTTGEITSGQIADQEGFEYYILKFGDVKTQTAELEMAYYRMATEAGIRMNECRLWEVDGVQHFLTKRFDRKANGEKIHMQTLAALDPEAKSYEELIRTCRRLQLPESEIIELFGRIVFNILANNTDDHHKNFSFLMDKSGTWSLSPAYDLTYIFNYGGFTPYVYHCLSLGGRTTGITLEDVLDLARENNVRDAEGIIRRVAKAIMAFPQYAAEYDVRAEWVNRIWPVLEDNMAAWHLYLREGDSPYRLEQTYKGNYHLYVMQPDGRERRYVIRPKMAEYAEIMERGITAIPDERFAEWIEAWQN